MEEKPKAKHCKGMEGLLKEGAECLKEEDKGALRSHSDFLLDLAASTLFARYTARR
jgi:hypothetical protein